MSDRYLVAGNPVAHSLSPRIHALFAAQTGQDLEYGRLLIEPGCFDAQARDFFQSGGQGMNVTVPCKGDACEIAEVLTERARVAAAVNTLWLDGEGRLCGDNTDGIGLIRDLCDRLHWQLQGRRVLILGAGGATRGILGPLLDCQPGLLAVANRTLGRAQDLVERFSGCAVPLEARPLSDLGRDWDLVLHATSAGLDNALPSLPADLLNSDGAAYDLFYAAGLTPFLRWAEAAAVTQRADGLGMLIEQAAEAFRIWRGIRPETGPVYRRLTSEIRVPG